MITATATGPSSTFTPDPGDHLVSIASSSWATNVATIQWYDGANWLDVDEILTPGTALSLTENRSIVLPGSVTYRLNPSAWSANIIARFIKL